MSSSSSKSALNIIGVLGSYFTPAEYKCMGWDKLSVSGSFMLTSAVVADATAKAAQKGDATARWIATQAGACNISPVRISAFQAVVYNWWGNKIKAHKYDPKRFAKPGGSQPGGGGGGGGGNATGNGKDNMMMYAIGAVVLIMLLK